jgi:hypothetical protein
VFSKTTSLLGEGGEVGKVFLLLLFSANTKTTSCTFRGEAVFFFFCNTFGRASPKIDGETSPTEGPGPYMHAHAAKGLAS